ncbi:MAG TPA: DUF309 domain-containing protein [Candidatus Binataceae bacterium]|nr:DUF309 domain-containing protein [Candidatus Binataceae bacterium]
MSDAEQNLFERGIELFNAGRFFACHEVWEDLWRRSRDHEKVFIQGMIQAAVAILHAERGNPDGARSQYEKAIAKLRNFPDGYRGIVVARLRDDLTRFISLATSESTDSVTAIPKIHRVNFQP